MEINRLNQDELTYELTIRGLPQGRVDEMRASLRAALRLEKDGRTSVVNPYPFTFDEDIEVLKNKVEEIRELASDFAGDGSSPEYKKIVTKVEWALGRLQRTSAIEEAQSKEKARVRADLIIALGSLQLKADGEDDRSDYSDEAEELSTTAAVITGARSRVPLYKWEIKFTGEQGQSLNSFLDRVQELADARGISKQQLFRSALDLFSGRALIWYRANKTSFHSWLDLVRELKKEFLPVDYDERLLEEIKRRTQGRDESMGMYVATMANMFSRLTDTLTEAQQLRVLKKNISPFYQTKLGLTEIESIRELIEFGRRLEAVRVSVESFVPPPSRKSNQLLEPDLAYVCMDQPNVSTIANRDTSSSDQRAKKCFKCGKVGHIARCFGCGALGIIRTNCTNCNSSNTRQNPSNNRRESQVSGNASGARA